jgi:predicted enzyme related to lactoylglutathione lyase
MSIVNVLTTLQVNDFDTAVRWYETLFGRAPDRRPMDGLAEWQLTTGGGVQVYLNAAAAGATTVVIGVESLDTHIADLGSRDIGAEVFDVPSGKFRLAQVQDPAGNTLTFSENLTPDN